ncbi:hypothetical protein PAPYR_4446 [Paratrimastix pyriformis]|uniref:Autophagy-related protein 27 n=1 Tax=Paratrimastix pyriformis TaxID=342808 RepID=A0ABQ8UKF0_9EUKA|nr:hypothetical protein PAPYR_4446 [Paratrimastix pyriformis]
MLFGLRLLLFTGAALVLADTTCTYGGIDFSQLGNYSFPFLQESISISPCATLSKGICNSHCCLTTGPSAKDCGHLPQWSDLGDRKYRVVFTGGENCYVWTGPGYTSTYNMQIDYVCDRSAGLGSPTKGPSFPTAECVEKEITLLPFVWPTSLVCVPESGMGWGTVCLIILAVVIPLYFVIGFFVKRKVKGTTGLDSIPHHDLLWSLPKLCWDGIRFTFCCKKPVVYTSI